MSAPSALAPADCARVMICDDSVAIRGAITRILQKDPGIEVVARVANGRAAIEELGRRAVDIVVLDIEMPVMDGLSALPLLLKADPRLRVIMASTLTTRGADIALRALRLGAADYIPKPSATAIADESFANDLIAKVKGLARQRRRTLTPQPTAASGQAGVASLARHGGMSATTRAMLTFRAAPVLAPQLLAIGSSTGGPQALFALVAGLGASLPVPVVLTQHMPPTFTPILADHLAGIGAAPCAEARDGEMLRPGCIHLAPGDRHLLVERAPGGLRVRLSNGPPENFCRPSVDPMLRSAAIAANGRVLVAMLTGMGQDGLSGTRAVVAAGGTSIAQDEETSIVWGMPGAIAQAGLCHRVLPLPHLAPAILDLLHRRRA